MLRTPACLSKEGVRRVGRRMSYRFLPRFLRCPPLPLPREAGMLKGDGDPTVSWVFSVLVSGWASCGFVFLLLGLSRFRHAVHCEPAGFCVGQGPLPVLGLPCALAGARCLLGCPVCLLARLLFSLGALSICGTVCRPVIVTELTIG